MNDAVLISERNQKVSGFSSDSKGLKEKFYRLGLDTMIGKEQNKI